MSPLTFSAMNMRIANSPMTVTHTYFWLKSPRPTSVIGAGRMKPPSFRPMVAMNRPIPTPIARFRLSGIAFMTASRRPVSTSARMMRPSTKMTDMPTCHGTFACWKPMSENVTTAFRPMPDASANGRLAMSPMQTHMSAAPSAVAVAAPPKGTPAAERMPGLTKMM